MCPFSPGGVVPYKPVRDVPFFRIRSRIPKQVMTICSGTIGYCFHYCFGKFCNLIIPEQGNFFLSRLWRFLKNGHLPVKLHSSVSPPEPFSGFAELSKLY